MGKEMYILEVCRFASQSLCDPFCVMVGSQFLHSLVTSNSIQELFATRTALEEDLQISMALFDAGRNEAWVFQCQHFDRDFDGAGIDYTKIPCHLIT